MNARQLLYSAIRLLPVSVSRPIIQQYRSWRDSISLLRASRYDRITFSRFSGLYAVKRREQLEGRLLKNYHRLEKGLALPNPRPGFGKAVAEEVLNDLHDYIQAFGPARVASAAIHALEEYAGFLDSTGFSSEWLRSRLTAFHSSGRECGHTEGGTREVDRSLLQATLPADVSAFMRSRHSVRHFAPGPIEITLIEKAVRAAQYAPSVCNRQSGHVFLIKNCTKQRALLQLQNGNSGFGSESGALLVVTSALDTFLTVGERYQPWIDGGLFGMSLLHALHGLGLGACALNWSVEPDTDRAFKRLSGVPDNHRIMFLIAAGHLLPRFRVAASARRDLAEVLHIIE
jgi:nitroreductase